MRFFIHIIGAEQPVIDVEGAEFPDAASAKIEAVAAARDLMAERLRSGAAVPLDWRVEIASADGRVIEAIRMETIVLGAPFLDRHRRLYEAVHHPYLLMSRDLAILEANPAYLKATLTDLSSIQHRQMFEVFPDNPGDLEANGVRNLAASLYSVLRSKRPHHMPEQRYDIRDRNGEWQVRYWRPVNIPVLDGNGDVDLIVHHVQDVTAEVFGSHHN